MLAVAGFEEGQDEVDGGSALEFLGDVADAERAAGTGATDGLVVYLGVKASPGADGLAGGFDGFGGTVKAGGDVHGMEIGGDGAIGNEETGESEAFFGVAAVPVEGSVDGKVIGATGGGIERVDGRLK